MIVEYMDKTNEIFDSRREISSLMDMDNMAPKNDDII